MKQMRYTFAALALALLLGLVGTLQTSAQGTTTWTARFFDNLYIIGEPDLTLTRNEVAFNWGSGSPGTNFPANNFTAQITTNTFFPAGEYRFYMLADDGATARFEFNTTLFDTFEDGRPGEVLETDLTVDRSGVYHIQIDYREYEGDAYVYFDWESLEDGVQGPNFPSLTPDTQPVNDIYWTGQYFNNPNLSGSPVAIIGQTGLSFNWGLGSPVPAVDSNDFSARWSGVYTLDGGEYLISVEADDGVRVYMDGILLIDQWRLATGEIYTRRISPVAGNHTFTVEYFEADGVALIDFDLSDVTGEGDDLPVTNATATVTAFRLNVRDAPSALRGSVLTRISRGETYPIVGRTADNSWVQINVGGTVGWSSTTFLNTTNLQNVPITFSDDDPAPQPTGFEAFTRTEVNLRTGPGTEFDRILILPQNITVPIVGRNLRATWWQVNYNGTIGWASAEFAVIEADDPNLNQIPVRSD